MLTLKQILDRLEDMGVDFAPRTFWKYVEMGLLPEGRKLPGQGNVLLFPEDTPARIAQLYTLNKDLGFPLHLLQRTLLYLLADKPWEKTAVPKPPSGTEFIVWMSGFMASQKLLSKRSLEEKDFASMNERVQELFAQFGIGAGQNER